MAVKWISTSKTGVRYYEHPGRKHGVRPDRYFAIRYVVDGQRREEGLGWASEGWNLERAVAERSKLKEAHRTGQGPATLEEKRAKAAQAKAEAERQRQLAEAQAVTLREYFYNDYLSTAKNKKKPESWGREVSLFENWIDPLLGHIQIQEIGVTQWDFLLAAMTDGGLSPRTRQYACLTLRLVLEHAFARKLITEMPPRGKLIGATLKPDSNRRTRIVTNDELQAILQALVERDPYAYRLTVFCALSCCRFSEAANLEWKDVDLAMGKVMFRNTKNGSNREIPLSDTLIDLLRSMGPASGHVFYGAQGNPYKQAPTSFREVVEELGLNEGRGKLDRMVFHSLRHSGATRLGQSGVPLRDMMDLAGWKTPAMALRYQHSGDAGRRRAMAALESMTQVESTKVVELFSAKV
ncbi:MAG: tyrosine-type recombinase/integrase [Desulfomicrobium sp.]